MAPDIAVYSFSGVYEREGFYREYIDSGKAIFRDLASLRGVNGYCSEDAGKMLLELMEEDRNTRIHFIDNGNYHYLSLLWLETIMEKNCDEYQLLYLDHHSDRQEASFGGLLSCGSWVKEAESRLPGLHKVFWVGSKHSEAENSLAHETYDFTSLFKSGENLDPDNCGLHKIPLYLSVDKDILSPDVVRTNWDQGAMRLEELLEILKTVLTVCDVRGIDICGSPGPDASDDDIRKDKEVNREIISFLTVHFWYTQAHLLSETVDKNC